MKSKKEDTTITISRGMRRRLMLWKANLDCMTYEELFDRILKIIPASEIKNFQENSK